MKTRTIHRIIFSAFIALLICLPLLASAAFITDKIVVEVRSERFGQGTVLKRLPSGTSVEVLMADGKYTRVRTADNITGWVASTFLTKQKPTQLEYLELLSKSKILEDKLHAAEKRLASSTTTDSGSNENIALLKKQAQDARWMKVEMMKARDRAQQAEAKLKAELKKQAQKGQQTKDAKQQLETLRAEKDELEKRLAAALLVNQQQPASASAEPTPVSLAATPSTEKTDDNWSIDMPWFFGSLFTALLIGFIAGLSWLDKRIRRRHGGFRIY